MDSSKDSEKASVGSRQWLARKQDLCSLLRDLHLLSEATDWLPRAGVAAKYRALRADVRDVQPELQTSRLSQLLDDSPNVRVHRIYSIDRFSERNTYLGAKLGNTRLLCHASHPKNLLGIIARYINYLPYYINFIKFIKNFTCTY